MNIAMGDARKRTFSDRPTDPLPCFASGWRVCVPVAVNQRPGEMSRSDFSVPIRLQRGKPCR
jgi:hypothetical protein